MIRRPEYPQLFVCNGVPNQATDFQVSVGDLTWVTMPHLKAERHPGFLILEVPAVTGATRIIIHPETLARPVPRSTITPSC